MTDLKAYDTLTVTYNINAQPIFRKRIYRRRVVRTYIQLKNR